MKTVFPGSRTFKRSEGEGSGWQTPNMRGRTKENPVPRGIRCDFAGRCCCCSRCCCCFRYQCPQLLTFQYRDFGWWKDRCTTDTWLHKKLQSRAKKVSWQCLYVAYVRNLTRVTKRPTLIDWTIKREPISLSSKPILWQKSSGMQTWMQNACMRFFPQQKRWQGKKQGRIHGNPCRGRLGRGSNEMGRGSNELGRGSKELGRGINIH